MAFFLIWQAIAMLVISLGFAAPPTSREMPDLINEKIDFAADIKPILQKNCTKCHSNGKSKGGFSIDHVHSVEAGGDSGPAIVKGKGSASLLVKLLLSNDSDEFMPPKGDRLP
ncbi:MAG: hypothetical protein HN584_11420, partial [Akkermansiaceae bacterium]|nr:hypothetical protein [Akkermansiaceae bacterium]